MMIMPAEMDPGGGGAGEEEEEARHKRRKRSTALVFTEVLSSIYLLLFIR